jgi:hypothetical protein
MSEQERGSKHFDVKLPWEPKRQDGRLARALSRNKYMRWQIHALSRNKYHAPLRRNKYPALARNKKSPASIMRGFFLFFFEKKIMK